MAQKFRIIPIRGEENAIKNKPLFRQPQFKRWKWHLDNKRRNNGRYKKILQGIVKDWKTHCWLCGASGPEVVLEAHHLDPSQKEIEISQANTVIRLQRELAKCVPLCRECHVAVHRNPNYCDRVRIRAEQIRSQQCL